MLSKVLQTVRKANKATLERGRKQSRKAVAQGQGLAQTTGATAVELAQKAATVAKAGAESHAVASSFAAVTAAGLHMRDFAVNLDWSTVDPTKYLYAGTRGESRGMTEAARVWEMIPEQIRMAGPEATADYLRGKDLSHVVAHSEGGSNLVGNVIWEDASLNRSRGATQMTPTEILAAETVSASEALQVALTEMAENAVAGGLAAVAVSGTLAVLEEGLRFQRHEIDERELVHNIGQRVAVAGLAGAAIAGLATGAAMLFPALLPVLAWISVPLAVLSLAAYASRLAIVGKGWYELWRDGKELRPLDEIRSALPVERAERLLADVGSRLVRPGTGAREL